MGPTLVWYSINMSLQDVSGAIFSGYFGVDGSNNVASFYETIDGVTDFNKNIYPSAPANAYDGADSQFVTNNFTPNGTNINYMNYYSNPSNTSTYNPAYAYFNLATSDGISTISALTTAGHFIHNSDNLSTFTIVSVPNPSCFNEGTKILCLNKNVEEEYIPVENLRTGDLVKSYKHGYRKIELIGKNPMINNPEKFNECMYKMEKTDDNGLVDDLIVTGGHAVLVDDLGSCKEENDLIFGKTMMIDDKYLLLCAISNDFVKLENTNLYTYYHFILENNGDDDERFGVWANGVLTETPSKTQFNNHKYTLL